MVSRQIEGSVALITGGTGSFGSTMARHLLNKGIGELRIFSRDEAKQDAMRHQLQDKRVRFYLGDTRDEKSVSLAVRGSQLVFHAAAIKQVPSAEFFPLEAVKTNVDGSANVLRASVENGVRSVVCLSTDKAVYPINAMGMTKALMEKTAHAIARENLNSDTTIAVTRYGNVMYSRGSVIPLFIRQIKEGLRPTVTDKTMTRFLMSLPESVDLVEHAFSSAQQGDLFVRKAPASTIGQLANVLGEMFGKPDLGFDEIGFRHGEKLFESLLSVEEKNKAEDLGAYFRVPMDTRDLNYEVFFEEGEPRLNENEAYTSHNTHQTSDEELRRLLLSLPEVKRELGID